MLARGRSRPFDLNVAVNLSVRYRVACMSPLGHCVKVRLGADWLRTAPGRNRQYVHLESGHSCARRQPCHALGRVRSAVSASRQCSSTRKHKVLRVRHQAIEDCTRLPSRPTVRVQMRNFAFRNMQTFVHLFRGFAHCVKYQFTSINE